MPNTYLTVDTFKAGGAINITGTAYDGRLRMVLEDVSRQIDRFCNRHFYTLTETRTFDGGGGTTLMVGDLVNLTALTEDTNEDGTFETTWATADYHPWPYNANPTADWGAPYTRLLVNVASNGGQDEFLMGQHNYQLAGTWGYRHVVTSSGVTGTAADGTGTSIILSGTAGPFEVGHTILIGSEQCYVVSVPSKTGTAITVQRGVNGSTGTAHTAAAVSIIQYPGPIAEAVLIQAARMWKRKDTAFASQVGMPETGQITVWRGGLDADVKDFIMPYRRIPLGLV